MTVTPVTATLTNVVFDACNTLTLGYELNGVLTPLETVSAGCGVAAGANQVTVYDSDDTFRLYLRDDVCGATFFDDGGHASVTGTNPFEVDITDGGGFCEFPAGGTRAPAPDGNISWTKTLS